jgi:phenylacetate 2-hydroxylase
MSDYVPLLRHLPWNAAGTASAGASTRVRRDKYMKLLLDDLKARIAKKTDIACICGNILKDPEAKINDAELSSINLSMVSAGLDTLANTFVWSVGYLAKHPEIQEKALAAINDVYHGGIPDSLTEDVPYIVSCRESACAGRALTHSPQTALHKECSRFFSVLKLSLPRATLGDSTYRGVHIPDNSACRHCLFSLRHTDPCRRSDRVPERMGHPPRRGALQRRRRLPARALPRRQGAERAEPLQLRRGPPHVRRRLPCRARAVHCLLQGEAAHTHSAATATLLTPLTAQLIYFFRILPGEEDYDIDPATACANPRGLSSAPKPFKVRFEPRNLSSIRSFLEEEKTKAEHAMAAGIGAGSTAVEKEAAAA